MNYLKVNKPKQESFLFQTDGSGTHVTPCWIILLLAGWGQVVGFGWQLAGLQGMRRLWLHLRPWWACSESWLSCPNGYLHVFSWFLHTIYPVGSYSLTQWLRHQECVIYEKNRTLCAPGPRRKKQWDHRRLTQTCLWVSRSLQQRHGSVVACCRVGGTEYRSECMGPFEGGHCYLHYLHHGLALGK